MDEKLFDLCDPFQKKVNERLDDYFMSGRTHDEVLDMIARDFPYMSAELRECCEHKAYKHFFTGDGNRSVALFKRVVVMHGNSTGEPLYSQKGTSFRLCDGEDLVAAVHVENPMFMHGEADVHLAFVVEGCKVNEFRHTMAADERRNVYYVPLDVLKNCHLTCNTVTRLDVSVVNENVEGQRYRTEVDIFYGQVKASDVFSVKDVSIRYNGSSRNRDVFYLGSFSSLEMYILLEYQKCYGDMSELEAVVTLSPSGGEGGVECLAGCVFMSESLENDGLSEGYHRLFKLREKYNGNESIPVYNPLPGKYTVAIHVWNELLWSKEIEIVEGVDEEECEESDETELMEFSASDDEESDILIDNFIEERLGKPVPDGATVNAGAEPDGEKEPEFEPLDYFQVLGLTLYNVDSDEDDNDCCLNALSSMPQTAFAFDKLKMLSVVGKIKAIKDNDIFSAEENVKWLLYDQTGRLVDTRTTRNDDMQGEMWICAAFGDFCKQKWEKGTYRLELQIKGVSLINAVFKVSDADITSDYDPKLIIRRDNTIRNSIEGSAIARLEKMAGLKEVKEKVHSLMNFHKLQKMRSKAGLPVKQPSLHARFLGNPGTGKTTVARLLGQIYKEMGLLSSGHVVLEERKNMIGRYYDSEGQAVENALNRAKGGILLIDEAYNLYVKEDEKDPGRRILEYLLTALSDEENRDWMLILAGYPNEMEAMLESNPGIKSRVNESFTFEDFSVDELMEIAELYCDDNRYELSEEARERLRSVVARDVAAKDKHFGNGRYVKKLMETAINTRMATRLSKIDSPTFDQLVTIEADDIPISQEEAERISAAGFDDKAIDEALKRLDSLVGLGKVKSAIHNFVNISRYLNSHGERYRGKGLLKWNFTGNTGTGKSTVAQILADILKAMNLVQNSEITEVKGEEIFNVSDYECNEVIRSAVKRSRKGVLFIDGDAPEFRSNRYRLTSEQVRFKLATLASEDNSSGALIIAECTTPDLSIAHSLAGNGVYDFDHTFIFDDYTADELYNILLQCLDGYKVTVSAPAETILREYIANLCTNRELSFANARTMKNLARAIFETLVLRLSESEEGNERVVLACDVESFVWRRKTVRLGF